MAWEEFSVSSGGGILRRQLFTASGTWTKPEGLIGGQVWVTMIGGGEAGYTLGGANGDYITREPIDVSSVESVAVTVGIGGVSSGTASDRPGSPSSFGALLSVSGGPGVKNSIKVTSGASAYSDFLPLSTPGPFGVNAVRLSEIYGSPGLHLGKDTPVPLSTTAGFGYGAGGGGYPSDHPSRTNGVDGAVLVEWLETA